MSVGAVRKNNVKISGNVNSDRTIVFGHGFGTDHTAWRFVKSAFEAGFRIVTYDNVGAGEADINAYSQLKYEKINSYASDLIDICDELDIRDAIFIGHSVSGMIGLLTSIKAPEFFSKHVFMNASPRYLNENEYIGGFDQADLDELYRAMANNYYTWVSGFAPAAMGNPEKPQLANEFAGTLSAIRPDIALAVARAIFQSDHRNDLSAFDKTSLIIQMKEDIAVPMEVGKYLNKYIKNSKLHVIDAQGYFPHLSAPEEVIKAIHPFLSN